MLLLQTQLDIYPEIPKPLELLGYFVAFVYAPSWFRAPAATEAAVIALELYKSLLSLRKNEVFRDVCIAAISALRRHLCYLTEELILFTLYCGDLQDHARQNLAAKIFHVYQQYFKVTMSPQKPVFPVISEDTKLETLVGERYVIIFQCFKFLVEDVQLLQSSCKRWNDFESFCKVKGLISTLHVTNDLAERSIKVLQDYKDILTEDSKHSEMILHYMEKTCQEQPDFWLCFS